MGDSSCTPKFLSPLKTSNVKVAPPPERNEQLCDKLRSIGEIAILRQLTSGTGCAYLVQSGRNVADQFGRTVTFPGGFLRLLYKVVIRAGNCVAMIFVDCITRFFERKNACHAAGIPYETRMQCYGKTQPT
jgi:hypothetical protein